MDLIFFAALAFFIFYKLSKQLGKVDEEERRQIEEKLIKFRAMQEQVMAQMKQQEKVIGASATKDDKAEELILSKLDDSTKENFLAILQRCNASASSLIFDVTANFESVIKAFAGADSEALKNLLSENIFSGFEAAINQRKLEEKTLVTNLISIDDVSIISASIFEDNAAIAIRFVSKQINYIANKDGAIVAGRKDEINEVTDSWTFKRNLNSPSKNWIISATNS